MPDKLLSYFQFLFPILAILCLITGIFSSYTIQISLGLLLVGFFFSIYLVILKKLILWGMINISLTIFIIIAGVITYFGMISSGV
ncbi:hypothetical protein [Neobacillus niacini]|uniref:hypothetical protein n=1 Tax=Neobacillus niacini TaxID=86668 RepID=UPI00286201B8|nr:hypothetical protein [Neobacillus niacini]MDR7001442.1 glucan phosphoethanolaminetransferase (alkaline phosphatase superfamily) [Neobacillus niacini]